MQSPWLGIGLVTLVFAALMLILRAARAAGLNPELSRKGMHAGMGCVLLSFPWLFHAIWPVTVLAASSSLVFLAVRFVEPLRVRFGGVVGGVARLSLGEIYFPVGAGVLFAVSHGDPVMFCIPVLILTTADAVAALVGASYGRHAYTTLEGSKSAEGSLAFFLAAFFSVHLPLLLGTQTGRAQTLLIALALAFLTMLLEAVAWQGLDNVFLPLGGFLLLRGFLALSVPALIVHAAVIAMLSLFVLIWKGRTTLQDSAVLAAVVIGYATWAIGGLAFLIPPLIVFVAYPLPSLRARAEDARHNDVFSVLSVTGAGLVWLALASLTHDRLLLYPYTLSYAVQLALVGIVRAKYLGVDGRSPVIVGACVGSSWLLLFAPYLWLEHLVRGAWPLTLAALPVIGLCGAFFAWRETGLATLPTTRSRLARQALLAGVGSLLALPVLAVPA